MINLLEIFDKFILDEAVSPNKVSDAIKKKERIIIDYTSSDPNYGIADGVRYIDPYCYGLSMAGNEALRAFQPFGDTYSSVPNWKLFLLKDIGMWKTTGFINKETAPNFNQDGDRGMSKVFIIADYKKQGSTGKGTNFNAQVDANKAQTEPDVFKTDTEKGMERLRQQLQNPKYIDDFNKDNNIPSTKEPTNQVNNINTTQNQDIEQNVDNVNNKPEDVFKTDTEKGIENLKQQVNNPTYLKDFDKINKGYRSPFKK